MAKINELIEKIKNYEGEDLTTNFLISELGITSYYIGVLTHKGIIEKVSRGVYKISGIAKNESCSQVIMNDKNNGKKLSKRGFPKFRDLVLEGHYEEAYDALVDCCKSNKDNHDFDNHYRMYFILLTAVLKLKGSRKKLDFDYDNNLLEFSEIAKTEYYESFLKAREAILSESYEEAYDYIKIYAEKEMRRYNENKISTVICRHLLEQISIMNNNKKKSSKMLNQAYILIKNKEYEAAKNILEELNLFLNTPKAKKLCNYLKELCEEIIKFKNDEKLILPDRQNIHFPEDSSIAHVFSVFMKNKDYLNAKMYINKCCELYKGSFYPIIATLLDELFYINKTHCFKKTVKTEIQEMRIKTNKNDGEARRHYSRFLLALQHLDFDKAYEEIKLNLSYIVNANSSNYSNSQNDYKLLKFLKNMQETKLPLEEVNYSYLTSDSIQFNFNRAMILQDWRMAYNYISQMDISNSHSLEANCLILKAIFRQDKINRGIELTAEDELRPLSSHLKKDFIEEKETYITSADIKSEISTLQEEEKRPLEDGEHSTEDKQLENYEDTSIKEVLDSIKNLQLNYHTLYNLIKNREFEEAFALIEREEQKGYSLDEVPNNLNQTDIKEKQQLSQESYCDSLSSESTIVREETVSQTPNEEMKKEISTPELTASQKHKLAILESIKDIELNYNNLYSLIYDKKYEEALFLLEREENTNSRPNRLNFNARRLISQYLHIVKGTFHEVEPKPIDYTQDSFKIFFAALNNRDYFLALDYVDECIDRAHEPEEMQLFRLILVDICEKISKIEEEKREKEIAENAKRETQTAIDVINKKLFAISNKQELDDKDIIECQKLLQDKVNISYENGLKFDKDELVLGVSEATLMALNKELTDCHFATMEVAPTYQEVDDGEISYTLGCNSTKIGDIFYDALRCGDLLTVEKLINTENWDNFRDKMNNTNLRLLKKLLTYMHEHMNMLWKKEDTRSALTTQKVSQELIDKTDKLAYELLNEQEKKSHAKVELLRKIGPLVKRQHYSTAIGEILESNVAISEGDPILDITTDILVAKEFIKTKSHILFEEFNTALNNRDVEKAREKLIEYSGYITSKAISRDLTYHRKRIDILEKDMKQPNFLEKEKIYDEALAMFYNSGVMDRYQKTIELLDSYIEQDNGINNKGYLLRALSYEKLKQTEKAQSDYKNSLQIAPSPIAFQALGTYAYKAGDYEQAIYYLEKFQAIRPYKDEKVSRMLVTSYNSIGQGEKSEPYSRHLKHLYYANIK